MNYFFSPKVHFKLSYKKLITDEKRQKQKLKI